MPCPDLSLEIPDGEFLVLVGPSGCGKTTALRMVAGLETITDGTISIGGRVVNELTPKDRDVAMVFQNYALYPHLSVADNIAFGLRLRKRPKKEVDDERITWAAKLLDLTPYLDAQAEGALRRPAPAGGDGPGDRPEPAGLPHGRAALEPRREAARPDARRDRQAPARARHDDDLRHARPDRGDDDGRPGRRHEHGRAAPGRPAAGAVRRAVEPLRRELHRHAADEPASPGSSAWRAKTSTPRSARRRSRSAPPACAATARSGPWRARASSSGCAPRTCTRPSPDPTCRRSTRPSSSSRRSAPACRPTSTSTLIPFARRARTAPARRRASTQASPSPTSSPPSRRGVELRLGSRVPVAVDPGSLHFFDEETGAALR